MWTMWYGHRNVSFLPCPLPPPLLGKINFHVSQNYMYNYTGIDTFIAFIIHIGKFQWWKRWCENVARSHERKGAFFLINNRIAYLSHTITVYRCFCYCFLPLSFCVAVLRVQYHTNYYIVFHSHTHAHVHAHINRFDCAWFYFDTYCIHIISILYGVDDDNIDNDNNGMCAHNMLERFDVGSYTRPTSCK